MYIYTIKYLYYVFTYNVRSLLNRRGTDTKFSRNFSLNPGVFVLNLQLSHLLKLQYYKQQQDN